MNKILKIAAISIFSFAIYIYITDSKKVKETKEMVGSHPGFFEQWYDWKKDLNGEIPANNYERWSAHDAKMQRVWSRRAGGKPIKEVKELGPSNVGGRTRALLVHPDNNNEIFAGGISGGLWTSKNGGDSWSQINDHQASLAVSCITMNPFNKKEIYYGTGEMWANSAAISGDGIFKSIDGGKTFSQLSGSKASSLRQIWTIEHSIQDDKVIFAGTNTGGMYYSIDAGKTWKRYLKSSGSICDIVPFKGDKLLVGKISSGVYSINLNTNTFQKLPLPHSGRMGKVAVENCKKYPNVVYAAVEGTSTHKVYKSSNGGDTWKYVGTANASHSYSKYCFDLAVHPTDTNKVMVSALAIAWSVDGGKTFVRKALSHPDHHSHAYLNGNNGNDILLGSDGGVSKHSFIDNIAQARNNGYKVTQFYAGNYGPKGDFWIAGTQDNGTYRYMNGIAKRVHGADGGYAHISQQNPNIAYQSSQRGLTKKTLNFQSTTPQFTSIVPSNITSEGVNFINQYHMNMADDNQLYYRTSRGLWRTIDGGKNWKKISTIGGANVITSTVQKDPILYMGKSSSRFYRIEKAATLANPTTISLNKNIPSKARNGNILGIEVHPKNSNTVFLAYGNNSDNPRIWKVENCDSADKIKWTNVSGNLPVGLPVNDIAVHPQAPDSLVFAATDFGLYYTTDSGKTWAKDLRIPSVAIFKIEMRPTDAHAFLFTHGRGVWRFSCKGLNETTALNKVNKLNFNIYPNPVTNGNLNISLVKSTGKIKVRILHLNGQEVLKSQFKETEKTISIASLKTGIYIVELKNNGYKSFRKIIVN